MFSVCFGYILNNSCLFWGYGGSGGKTIETGIQGAFLENIWCIFRAHSMHLISNISRQGVWGSGGGRKLKVTFTIIHEVCFAKEDRVRGLD